MQQEKNSFKVLYDWTGYAICYVYLTQLFHYFQTWTTMVVLQIAVQNHFESHQISENEAILFFLYAVHKTDRLWKLPIPVIPKPNTA